jgi:VIT1/CCC1 family predicted Fe2+/Mn2+ transporter
VSLRLKPHWHGLDNGHDRGIDRLRSEHTRAAVTSRLTARRSSGHLRDFIYGAIDGAVTTFAVVAGVAGAGLKGGVVIVLGMANLIADGFSMAVSNYLGTRAERQLRERARREEQRHITVVPDGEREEIRQILAGKGFEEDELERAVEIITSDDDRWIDTMMTEELGFAPEAVNELSAAAATFTAFVVVGFVPLTAFVYDAVVSRNLDNLFLWSAAMTAAAFFVVGALKSRFVDIKWWIGGLEILAIGGAAATLAYVVGGLLKSFVSG